MAYTDEIYKINISLRANIDKKTYLFCSKICIKEKQVIRNLLEYHECVHLQQCFILQTFILMQKKLCTSSTRCFDCDSSY